MASYQELWQTERGRYKCVTSEEVLREAALGDAEMSRRRAELLAELIVLEAGESVRNLARDLVAERILPPGAASDAIHVAITSLQGVDILVTWNCRHLANPHLLGKLRNFMVRHGLVLPEICTPIELIGE